MGKINNESYIINDKKLILRTAEVQDSERIINLLKKIDEETTFMLREPGEFQLSIEQEEKSTSLLRFKIFLKMIDMGYRVLV